MTCSSAPRSCSAALRSSSPSSFRTTVRPCQRLRATLTGAPRSQRTLPGEKRAGKSVRGSTLTSPWTPWGASTRPAVSALRGSNSWGTGRSVADVEDGARVLLGGSDFQEGADGLGDAAAAADDFAHVRLSDVEVEHVAVAVEVVADLDLVSVLDQVGGDVLDQLPHLVIFCACHCRGLLLDALGSQQARDDLGRLGTLAHPLPRLLAVDFDQL